ncbi:HlyD family efflux transporter periplasmic adaptor subunit [Bradyrhizobium arachidis]|uniref:efflux RND transporter periplasmic adaptor subunit n=1 Tax=Bradyrhizobium arachidis TaxID=858423 RepID=UPI0028682ABA|nr:HlyD family efflux transporter periplasmic adaptor subunit [Bradyrhizobium arachidis]
MNMRIAGRHIGMAAGILTAAGIAIWLLVPVPVAVETSAVTKGRFVATVDEDGKTRVRERYVVAAPLAGRLGRIRFKVGDQVQVNDAVATIWPSPAPLMDPRTRREVEERLGMAEANLERTKAVVERVRDQVNQANTDLTRARTLAQQGAATVQTLERAELAARLADRDLRAAEFQDHAAGHEISQMRALLARYGSDGDGQPESWSVASPVAGVVLGVTTPSETTVQPGTPLLDIGDARDLEIVADVLSTDAVEIRAGADVTIDHWGGEGKLRGRVRRVEPAAFTKVSTLGVEEQRVNVLVDLLSPPGQWARLGDGYQVDVEITVFAKDDATIVPSGALFRRGERWNVYVAKDGRAELRQLELLRRSGRLAAVASGLAPGEKVIVYPSDRVAPGKRVSQRTR